MNFHVRKLPHKIIRVARFSPGIAINTHTAHSKLDFQRFVPSFSRSPHRDQPATCVTLSLHTKPTNTPTKKLSPIVMDANTIDDEILNDVALTYDRDLDPDHGPATSNGTYLDGVDDSLESLEEYKQDGYHPIHLGDTLGTAGRYHVIHKLGHGGFGTVWLCRDTQSATYVAVKVMIAHVAQDTLPDLTLARLDQSAPGAKYIAIPLDSFSVSGPNGMHQCIVLPALGPQVSPRLWIRMKRDPGRILRGMAHQATQGLEFLHSNGICHGDFRPSNILVKLINLDQLSEEELLSILGEPEKVLVCSESGDDLPESSPQYLVYPADTSLLGDEYLTDEISIIDFGESYQISEPPEDLGTPENYLPPEVLLGHENVIGPSCDLWALGCTLLEIRKQIPLFYMIYDQDDLIAEMVRFFGKLPPTWWEEWEGRSDYFDSEGTYTRKRTVKEKWTLEVLLSKSSEVYESGGQMNGATPKTLSLSATEQRLMADLLYKIFNYDAEKRLSAKEVLKHEWFKM